MKKSRKKAPLFSVAQKAQVRSLLKDLDPKVQSTLVRIMYSTIKMNSIRGMHHRMRFLAKILTKELGAWKTVQQLCLIKDFCKHLEVECDLACERMPFKIGKPGDAYIVPIEKTKKKRSYVQPDSGF